MRAGSRRRGFAPSAVTLSKKSGKPLCDALRSEKGQKMKTYLLPIWIDIEARHTDSAIKWLNGKIEEALDEIAREFAEEGGAIDIQWSVTKKVDLRP